LIVGVDILGSGTLVAGANRDEDPSRPSLPPGVLNETPRVVGGRDAVAGGTWLAVRDAVAAIAILNRRPRPDASQAREPTRSRGRLALDVACVEATSPGSLGDAAYAALEERVRTHVYAPFALAWLSSDAAWVAWQDAGTPLARRALDPGWHVLTHADLDDDAEPRTRFLRTLTRRLAPASPAEAETGLHALLGIHGEPGGDERVSPPVCLHSGRMVTVSSAILTFAPGHASYRHSEGRPCTERMIDYSALLETP
jgi:uncharacterized protein with NRDE domain